MELPPSPGEAGIPQGLAGVPTARGGGGECPEADFGPRNLPQNPDHANAQAGTALAPSSWIRPADCRFDRKERWRPLFCQRTEGTVGSSSGRKPPAARSGTVATEGLSLGNPTQTLRQMQGLVSHLPCEAEGVGSTSPGPSWTGPLCTLLSVPRCPSGLVPSGARLRACGVVCGELPL